MTIDEMKQYMLNDNVAYGFKINPKSYDLDKVNKLIEEENLNGEVTINILKRVLIDGGFSPHPVGPLHKLLRGVEFRFKKLENGEIGINENYDIARKRLFDKLCKVFIYEDKTEE